MYAANPPTSTSTPTPSSRPSLQVCRRIFHCHLLNSTLYGSSRRFIPQDAVVHHIKSTTVGVWSPSDIFQGSAKCTQLQRGAAGRAKCKIPLQTMPHSQSWSGSGCVSPRAAGERRARPEQTAAAAEPSTSKLELHNLFIKASWYPEWPQLVPIEHSRQNRAAQVEQRLFYSAFSLQLSALSSSILDPGCCIQTLQPQYRWKSLQYVNAAPPQQQQPVERCINRYVFICSAQACTTL